MTNEAITLCATLAQAFAAIVALVISSLAIVVPSLQQAARNKRQDKERELEAKCLATAIRLSLHDVRATLAKSKLWATGHTFQAGAPNVLPLDYQLSKIEIPQVLLNNLDQLYLLGDPTGPLILRLGAVLNTYNDAVEMQFHQSFTDPSVPVINRWKLLIEFIEDIEPKINEALTSVSAIAEAKTI